MVINTKLFAVRYQSNTRMWDVRLGTSMCHLRILVRVPTDQLQLKFVRPTQFVQVNIVHPNGGGGARLRCLSCGAEYPLTTNPHPCANCAVQHESGVIFEYHCNPILVRVWTDHAYAVERNVVVAGQVMRRIMVMDGTDTNAMPVKFTALHDAMKATQQFADGGRVVPYPYPIKNVSQQKIGNKSLRRLIGV